MTSFLFRKVEWFAVFQSLPNVAVLEDFRCLFSGSESMSMVRILVRYLYKVQHISPLQHSELLYIGSPVYRVLLGIFCSYLIIRYKCEWKDTCFYMQVMTLGCKWHPLDKNQLVRNWCNFESHIKPVYSDCQNQVLI